MVGPKSSKEETETKKPKVDKEENERLRKV